MKSEAPGIPTSAIEITHISSGGFGLLVGDRQLFVTYDDFPWFRGARADAIRNVTLPHPRHLRWPDLDIDLAIESIEYPDRFPLTSSD